ncbi:A24 family peptidase [Microbacterium sp. BK668]|uniref:prepilin peptidase n=1 Tax=Microbacterium sp. BK668 TaxID=2512118 RepID=UPI0010CE1170|nr:A24 family peptidase [Microbacterium sp. BK668]TDN93232.1 leader peptidase (prepilin peptidase)/N-methyltransferase [Microbacterium sp. BK668]
MSLLLPFTVVVSGILGLLIGSFLNVVAVRVPVGAPLTRESRCPQCDAAIKPWHNIPVGGWLLLRGRCASCGEAISPRYPIVEAITGVLFAVVAWLMLATSTAPLPATYAVLVAFLYFAAISVVLALIDLGTHRLPDAIVLPSYVVAGVLLTAACVLGADWSRLLSAGVGGAILYAFYFVIRFIRPDGMGGGDVKLAGVVGIYLGWLGWGALAVGAFSAFVLGGLFGLALIAVRRAGRRSAIPFGPWMLAGAWVGIFMGQALGAWYVSLLGL